jgi:hypothetical protein
MPEFTVTLNINVSVEDGTVTLRSSSVDGRRVDLVEPDEQETGGPLSHAVVRMVEERSPRTEAARYRRFLERCAAELGARPVTPESGDRAYININPPAGVRGSRLCALTLSSGRLAFHSMAPELAKEWPDAEPVSINGTPTYVRIYLRGDEQVEQAMAMTRAVLDER